MPEDAFKPASEVESGEQTTTVTVGCWVKDPDGTWHASTRYDGRVHTMLCDEEYEAPKEVFDVILEPIEDRDPDDGEPCEDCQAVIDAADEVSGHA